VCCVTLAAGCAADAKAMHYSRCLSTSLTQAINTTFHLPPPAGEGQPVKREIMGVDRVGRPPLVQKRKTNEYKRLDTASRRESSLNRDAAVVADHRPTRASTAHDCILFGAAC